MIIINKNFLRFSKDDRLNTVVLDPPSNGPKVREIYIPIGREVKLPAEPIGEYIMLIDAKIIKTAKGGLMIVGGKPQGNATYLFDSFSGGHRQHARIDLERSSMELEIVAETCGYGSWGSGVAFLAKMPLGTRLVSTGGNVLTIGEDGEVIRRHFDADEFDANFRPEEGEEV